MHEAVHVAISPVRLYTVYMYVGKKNVIRAQFNKTVKQNKLASDLYRAKIIPGEFKAVYSNWNMYYTGIFQSVHRRHIIYLICITYFCMYTCHIIYWICVTYIFQYVFTCTCHIIYWICVTYFSMNTSHIIFGYVSHISVCKHFT